MAGKERMKKHKLLYHVRKRLPQKSIAHKACESAAVLVEKCAKAFVGYMHVSEAAIEFQVRFVFRDNCPYSIMPIFCSSPCFLRNIHCMCI